MKMFIRISGALYAALLFYIFFLARRRPHATLFRHNMPKNIFPLKNRIAELGYYHNLSPWLKLNFIVNIVGNIGLFVPIVFFLRFIFKITNPWLILFICGTMSTCVELTQYIFSIGVADIDDIILNTVGAALGILLLTLLKKWLPRLYLISDNQIQTLSSKHFS